MVYLVQGKTEVQRKVPAATDKFIGVDFVATCCELCKIISPKLEDLANQDGDKVIILKGDVDDCKDLDGEYGVSSRSTFVFIRNCEKIDSFVGANAEELETRFAKHLEASS